MNRIKAVKRLLPLVLLLVTPLSAQEARWTVDVTPASYVETWDLNDRREWLGGVQGGVDRSIWRGIAVRGEGLLLHVRQATSDTWLRGGTLGLRFRSAGDRLRGFVDLAGGRASAGAHVPPGGTRANYLLLLGGGVELPWSHGRTHVVTGIRWFHVSNNGSEGRHRNPDVQALGGFAGLAWRF
jgi:hypothetical protein